MISLTQPQIGQPDTTEDVKIQNNFTTLQNVINGNLDTNNLSSSAAIKASQLAAGAGYLVQTPVNVSASAAAGQMMLYYGTGGHTITLPTPTLNALVGVTCVKQTLASALTVTAGSGSVFGGGIAPAGVASFQLGSCGDSVTLLADGTNWFIISGQQDTGWVAIGLTTNWATNAGCYAAAYRVIGDRAYLRGTVKNNTGSNTNNPFAAALPVVARPASTVTLPVAYTDTAAYATVTNAGVFATADLVNSTATLGLDGVTYSLS